MEESIIKCVTKGNSAPNGKARVYFTCHPDDFDKYFDKVCSDIFKSHEPAIYYTPDMTAEFEEENKEADLGRNNLFVIPVTYKLLTTKNRAMNHDFPYAKKNNIPVLPLMMEKGLDELYRARNKFSNLQYLNPFSTDYTEISYEEKLKKFLNSVIIGDELAKRVRGAFDAYIFLSYRKKDRRYANELMKLIHNNPECRNTAIWFDEFLSPGESFTENIDKILKNSKLFALLVTPNLLEEPGGKPNFVMGTEYPAALASGMKILPAEMEETNKDELSKKFDKLPSCINPVAENERLRKRLVKALALTAKSAKDDNPEHNFLIGLAYLEGIDVEVNRDLGMNLINSAARDNLPEAMEKLRDMYLERSAERQNGSWARYWAEKIYSHYKKIYGEESRKTLAALNVYADILRETGYNKGDYKKAFELSENAYKLCEKVFGESHPETLSALNILAQSAYKVLGFKEACKLFEKVCSLSREALGKEHKVTLASIYNYGNLFYNEKKYRKAYKLFNEVYNIRCTSLGEENPDTLRALDSLAESSAKNRKHKKALECRKKEYPLYVKIWGEHHPNTLSKLSSLAKAYSGAWKNAKAEELFKKVYDLRCTYLGEDDHDSVTALHDLSKFYLKTGHYGKSGRIMAKACLYSKPLVEYGVEIPAVLDDSSLSDEERMELKELLSLADSYEAKGDKNNMVATFEKAYERCRTFLGEENAYTINMLNIISTYCWKFFKIGKAYKYYFITYRASFKMMKELYKDITKKPKK